MPRIFYTLRKAKNFQMVVPFEAYLINSLRFSEFNSSHFTPQIKLFFAEKGNVKFSDSKMRWKEESERKIVTFLKRLKLPKDDRTDKNLIASIRMYF